MIEKEYLGDGVYVDYEGGFLKLTTENGRATTNEIFLDATVMKNFDRWRKRLDEETEKFNANSP